VLQQGGLHEELQVHGLRHHRKAVGLRRSVDLSFSLSLAPSLSLSLSLPPSLPPEPATPLTPSTTIALTPPFSVSSSLPCSPSFPAGTGCATLHATHTLASLDICSATAPFGGASYKITEAIVDHTITKLTLGLFNTHSCTGGLSSSPSGTSSGTIVVNTCTAKSLASDSLFQAAFKLIPLAGGLVWEEFTDSSCTTHSAPNKGGSIAVLNSASCVPLGLGGKYAMQAVQNFGAPSTGRMLITQYSDAACMGRSASFKASASPITFVGSRCYKNHGKSYKWEIYGAKVTRKDFADESCSSLHATHPLEDVGKCSPHSTFGGAAYRITEVTLDTTTTHLTMGIFDTAACTGGLSATPSATTTGTVNADTCRPKSTASGALIAEAFKLIPFNGGVAWEEYDDAGCSTFNGHVKGASMAILDFDHCEPLGMGGKFVKQTLGSLAIAPTKSPTRSPTDPGATHAPTPAVTRFPTSYPTPPTRAPTRFPTMPPTPKQCVESHVSLMCHAVHGYPKQACQSWCTAKGKEHESQSVYRAGTTIDLTDCTEQYGGPWSQHTLDPAHTCPLFTNPSTCAWTQTTTTQTTDLYIALSDGLSSEHAGGSEWEEFSKRRRLVEEIDLAAVATGQSSFKESETVLGKHPYDLSSGEFTVKVSLRSISGPVMQGKIITEGCGPGDHVGSLASCFGRSSAMEVGWAIALLVISAVLCCCCCCCWICLCSICVGVK